MIGLSVSNKPRERGGGKVHNSKEQLAVMPGGLAIEEYCRKLIRAAVDSESAQD
jgi:hypothetical protein